MLYWISLREAKWNPHISSSTLYGWDLFSAFRLFAVFLPHLTKDRFNRATPTLNLKHTSACQLYAHKSSGSQDEGGLHIGITVVYTLKAFCLTGRPWLEQRYRCLGGCHGKDNDSLMIFFLWWRGKRTYCTGGPGPRRLWWPASHAALRLRLQTQSEEGERRLITPMINGHMSSNGTWVRLPVCAEKKVQLLLMRSTLSWAAAGHTAAGHWRYFHNMSQSIGVMTCKC